MRTPLDPDAARRILKGLAETGQPPRFGASFFNVGTDSLLRGLRDEYLEDLLAPIDGRDGGGACKWVEANYGNGKTQFLRCVEEMAWKSGYVTSFVELSRDECPLDRSDRVFGAIARAAQAGPTRSTGLDLVLRELLERRFPAVLAEPIDDDLRDSARTWVETTLRATAVESNALREAAARYLLALLNDDDRIAKLAATYLRGEPIPSAILKSIGIHEKLDKSSGFRLLRSVCQLLQRSGLARGTVLLFDEARRSLSLMTAKAQKEACENLLGVINRCNSGDMPGTLFVYGVMPSFFLDFATRYPALQQRCGPATRINLENLRGLAEIDLLVGIGEKIAKVAEIAAIADALPSEFKADALRTIAERALRRSSGDGTRRLLARAWSRFLLDAHDRAPRALADADVDRLLEGAIESTLSQTTGGE